jgi:Zn-dependent protease with chaperone function
MTEFRETQRIDRGLLVFLALTSIAAIVGPLVLTYQEALKATGGDGNDITVKYLLIASGAFVFTVLVFSLVASQRLEIDINKYRFRFRMPPFVKWKEIAPEEIESFRVEKAKWFQKMRKSRMHYNPFTKKASYMMARKYFVELKLTNGKTILLSTKMPDEMLNALEGFKLKGK